ncbi:MAG: flagellar biosynthesis anti-sigma factor FlgM [Ignavibacterium album]|uniref:flagellar biosynthesis anti-sigma factor FlgM n=1 Tax=Ignavibacterium album TaxID=591197 RepID=UPI0026F213A6|nr:flagellar biosynthesis anti-sigma factor FlgM [Ignavibacterium album]MBI5662655.1 flagellar biosynthesis anti-sigma factor FlgM [Ignavibacterium album]
MEIKGITPKSIIVEENKNNKSVKKEIQKKDSLEISREAKELQQKSEQVKDLSLVRERIKSGFYNSEEVLNKVAEKILKDLNGK